MSGAEPSSPRDLHAVSVKGQTGLWLCPCSTEAPQFPCGRWACCAAPLSAQERAVAGLAWAWLLTLLLTLVEASSPLAPEKPVTTTLSLWGFWRPLPCPPHPHHTCGHLRGFQNAVQPWLPAGRRSRRCASHIPLWQRGSVVTGSLCCLAQGWLVVVPTESKHGRQRRHNEP